MLRRADEAMIEDLVDPIQQERERYRLTKRETDVIEALVAEPAPAKMIAKRFGLSPRTVEIHLVRIREKLRAKSTVEAALIWDRLHRPGSSVAAPPVEHAIVGDELDALGLERGP